MFDEERQPLRDDNDLAKRAAKDDFVIKRIWKFAVLASAVIILLFVTIVFCWQTTNNTPFRTRMLDIIQTNIAAIVIAGLAIIGINVRK
jgi:heme/copper-type cytochrome/quinol oxidase subunit 2